MTIELIPARDVEKFITDLQAAFRREDGSNKFRSKDLPKFFERSGATLLNIFADKELIGGAVLMINSETNHNKLSLFFINEPRRGQGLGYLSWRAIEKFYPDTKVWYAQTAWLDKRNLHFYLNKCGFVAFSIYDKGESYLAMEKVMK